MVVMIWHFSTNQLMLMKKSYQILYNFSHLLPNFYSKYQQKSDHWESDVVSKLRYSIRYS